MNIDSLFPKKHNEHISLLKCIAEDTVPSGRAKIASAIVIKNRVVSIGTNSDDTHPFQAKFARNKQSLCWHSETHCIYRALKKGVTVDDFAKADLYVVRVKRPSSFAKDYVFGNAQPCKGCMQCIDFFGIRDVYYSTDDNDIRKAA